MKGFAKGKYIVYGNAGVCYIEDIRMIQFDSEQIERMYYVLQPISRQSSTLYIPTDNERLNKKMRYVLTKEEIDEILQDVCQQELMWEEDKKVRQERNKQVLQEKDQEKMLLLVSCIYLKKQELEENGKKMNTTDENVLRELEHYINEEFAFSLHLPVGQVGEYIREHLGVRA